MDKGEGQVRYILNGEGAMSIFTIDENTGDIHATKRLDREQQAYYTLRAQARDQKTNLLVEPESQFIIKVQDINDNEPKFLEGPYTASVAERSPVGVSECLQTKGGTFLLHNMDLELYELISISVKGSETYIKSNFPFFY